MTHAKYIRLRSKSYVHGFTLIELLVAISIILILAAIVLSALGSGRNKANDSRVQLQLKSMSNQAQLYVGAVSAVAATTTAPTGAAGGNLFTDSTVTNNSLYRLASTLPSGTAVYYASNATAPVGGGQWAFAASTSTGSFCIDYTGVGRLQSTTVMTAGNAATLYTNLSGSYTCN